MKLVVINNSKKILAEKGALLIKVLQRNNIPITALCGGSGRYGRCRVKIEGQVNPPDEVEKILIPQRFLKQGFRLACRYRVEKNTMIKMCLKKIHRKESKSDDGFALDLGTTLIKGARVDIGSGESIKQIKVFNLQNSFGGDVLSRVGAAIKGNYKRLRNLMLSSIIDVKEGLGIKNPLLTVVVGNPVMLSFYLNKSVVGFGGYPFRAELKGLIIKQHPMQIILPIIGGFVGSDTVAGIIAGGLYNKKKIFLYIDLGTNGEVALIKNGQIIVTSTAAGPAFEGVGFIWGSPAVDGAIEHITFKNRFRIKTINNKKPIGICASGMIDLLVTLLNLHWLTPDGRLLKRPQFGGITIQQADIRRLQLATGAIHTGIKILMRRARVKPNEIDATVITGEFGSHLTPSSLFEIGLLPRGIKKVYFKTDLPLKGAILTIKDSRTIEQARRLCANSEHVELALEPDFQKIFVQSMKFSQWN